MAKVPEMTADFARWYSESFMDEGAKRDLRWKGVVAITTKADHLTAEVLARLAFPTAVSAAGRKNEKLSETYSKVVSTISGGDGTFDPAQSARELQILASAALFRLVGNSPDAALIVTTTSFGGNRAPELPMDLTGKAERALVELSERKHARAKIDEIKSSAPKVEFSIAAEALQSMDPSQWKEQIDGLWDATTEAIALVIEEQNRITSLLHKQILLDEEELQMLWWLLGGFSRHLNKPFSEIETALKPMMLAFELGEMTAVSPGPISIRAMLARSGIGAEKLKIVDAVNSSGVEWAKSVSNSPLVSPVTTPLHFALEQRAELGSTETWQSGWSGLTGLAMDTEMPAIKLAELFYREHLFINVNG